VRYADVKLVVSFVDATLFGESVFSSTMPPCAETTPVPLLTRTPVATLPSTKAPVNVAVPTTPKAPDVNRDVPMTPKAPEVKIAVPLTLRTPVIVVVAKPVVDPETNREPVITDEPTTPNEPVWSVGPETLSNPVIVVVAKPVVEPDTSRDPVITDDPTTPNDPV
jgi:hypothetical protein